MSEIFKNAGTYETGKQALERMYKEMHDDDYIKEQMRKNNVKKMKEEKMSDTGL